MVRIKKCDGMMSPDSVARYLDVCTKVDEILFSCDRLLTFLFPLKTRANREAQINTSQLPKSCQRQG